MGNVLTFFFGGDPMFLETPPCTSSVALRKQLSRIPDCGGLPGLSLVLVAGLLCLGPNPWFKSNVIWGWVKTYHYYGGITIHLPAIFVYHPGTRVLTHNHISRYQTYLITHPMGFPSSIHMNHESHPLDTKQTPEEGVAQVMNKSDTFSTGFPWRVFTNPIPYSC